MEDSCSPAVSNFKGTDILRNILLRPSSPVAAVSSHKSSQENAMNPLRPNLPSGVLMPSAQPPSSNLGIAQNLVTHKLSNMKSPPGAHPQYPLQLHLGSTATVNVPVQLATSTTNINVPVQIGSTSTGVPLQISAPGSLPTNIPVQLPGGAAVNVPLQFPASQGQILPSMPLLQTSSAQPGFNSSIIHVQLGTNGRPNTVTTEPSLSNAPTNPVPSTSAGPPSVQVGTSNPIHILPSAQNNPIQLGVGTNVNVRSNLRVPQVVYINPTNHKPVSAPNTVGNKQQIIVRRSVSNSSAVQYVSNANAKKTLAPKINIPNKSSILSSGNPQPIVIQKPKMNSNMIPVSIATNTGSKQAFAYLGQVKKQPILSKPAENQSILLQNNQLNSSGNQSTNQKVFLTPMMQKIQNTKYIIPVTPGAMASKGPIINLQISNGQLQNDSQGNITVMKETETETSSVKSTGNTNNRGNEKDDVPIVRSDKPFTLSIPGSRAEPTGEQEYTLSIPETNASMNDDIYTVSIADDEGAGGKEKSFTLAIPEKGKSLLNKTTEKDTANVIPAPAILRRSNSENNEKKPNNLKRRISLCAEKIFNKKHITADNISEDNSKRHDSDNDDHEVPSLFCDEKFDKDLDKANDCSENSKSNKKAFAQAAVKSKPKYMEFNEYNPTKRIKPELKPEVEIFKKESKISGLKRDSTDSTSEEDPPGLVWNNGVAQLQGSDIHFQTNEFGLIDVMDQSDRENHSSSNSSAKYHTPLKQRIEGGAREKKAASPEDLYRCDGCGCHGMAADFITPNFCSVTCQQDYHKLAPQRKKERDKAEMLKKRNKIKKLMLQQRQDAVSEKAIEPSKGLDDSRLNPLLLKVEKEPFDNEKYPWMCGTNGFSWLRYLEHCKAKAAPAKLFPRDPFPYNCKNGFRVGMKLEAIDPARPAIFSVVTVVETQGYRMRLHFDSYPDSYDFWVNADSIDIFPPGWCDKNGRVLKPPQGFTTTSFNWSQYLKQCKAVAAPKHLFPHTNQGVVKPHGFRVGMKLEAEDLKDGLICVATVADTLDSRVLINFDSWDEKYDYWVEPTSSHIHPAGWAEENGQSLTPPNFYKDPDSFTWEGYLRETGASAVPARAFKPRPPHGFKVGMKLEVVDKRVPFLIRVATVSEVKSHSMRISYDGWPERMSVWLEDDSPDIHPVGWCLKTSHPLEPPLTPEELCVAGACGAGGCRGLGSLRGGPHKTHASAAHCPYALPRPPSPQDRACPAPFATHLLPKTRTVSSSNKLKQKPSAASTPTPSTDSQRDKISKVRPEKQKRAEEPKSMDNMFDEESNASSTGTKRSRGAEEAEVEASVLSCAHPPRAARRPAPAAWQRALARLAPSPRPDTPAWTQEEVCDFIASINLSGEVVTRFRQHKIGGAELLMLSQEELVDVLQLKLGPAIKLYNCILQLRRRVDAS